MKIKLHCFGCAWQCPHCRPQSATCMRQGADNLWWWPEEIIRKCCSSVIACSPLILSASTFICAAQYYLICFRPFVWIYEMSAEFSSNWRRSCFLFFSCPYVCRFIWWRWMYLTDMHVRNISCNCFHSILSYALKSLFSDTIFLLLLFEM